MSEGPIVAGTDGSSRAELAVDRAAELAQALGAAVHVACVPGAIAGAEWPQRVSAQQIVARTGDRLRDRGIPVETHLPKDEGDASLALIAVAEHVNAQMIVVGNKGMTGIRRLLGSLPNRVSHQARCDVLIVPTDSQSLADFGNRSIVVATDGPGAAWKAVAEAIRLAKALNAELHVASIDKGGAGSGLESAAAEAARQGISVSTHPINGDAADGLLELAASHDASIIVVAGEGMRGPDRDWFGNVADKLSHKGAVSLLIVTGETRGAEPVAASGIAAGEELPAG